MSGISYAELGKLEEEYYSFLEKENRLIRRIKKVYKKQIAGNIDDLMDELYDLRGEIYNNLEDLSDSLGGDWTETLDETADRYKAESFDEMEFTLEDVLKEGVIGNDKTIKKQIEQELNSVRNDISELKEKEKHLLEELKDFDPEFTQKKMKTKKNQKKKE